MVWQDEKYLRNLKRLFKYQHIYSMVDKKMTQKINNKHNKILS